jgi:hypothetical protein
MKKKPDDRLRLMVFRALRECRGCLETAARRLGQDPKGLAGLCGEFRIDVRSFQSPGAAEVGRGRKVESGADPIAMQEPEDGSSGLPRLSPPPRQREGIAGA